ncbi:MAG TPA: histidine kinase dimerization/phospho-acceptor domain-containing protein [candidate division Zixibacteria bacterium]|nr:histidine kinase dimerization/phospho-acceptor domain-containing protein [candidate division Zixibacteria bacterium]
MEAEAEINAALASQVVSANPEMWRFQVEKLEEFLRQRPRKAHNETRRILDNDRQLVAESVDPLDWPVMTRSDALFDAGVTVGQIEISRSLRPLLLHAGELFVFGSSLGLGLFLIFRVVPLRLLNRALADNARFLEDLKRANGKLEAANRELARQAADLAKASKLQADFAAMIAHDLRSPLMSIAGAAEVMMDGTFGEVTAEQ